MNGPTQTILVAERDEERRSYLCAQLVADGYEPIEARAREECRLKARDHAPALVLLGGLEGPHAPLALLSEIRSGDLAASGIDPALPVIVVSPDGGELPLLRAFDAGADDVVCPEASYLELRARARALLRRASGELRRTRQAVGALLIDRAARTVSYQGTELALSQLEYALLDRLATEPQRVFTKQELLREVWGYRSEGRTRTLDAHACRLRRKLAAAGAPHLVLNRRGVGYALLGNGAGAALESEERSERGRALRAA